jgi:hypothetical protein
MLTPLQGVSRRKPVDKLEFKEDLSEIVLVPGQRAFPDDDKKTYQALVLEVEDSVRWLTIGYLSSTRESANRSPST